MRKYILVTNWYDNAEVGSIWELIEEYSTPIDQKMVWIVKTDTPIGHRWIGKCCGKIITKEKHPEEFL